MGGMLSSVEIRAPFLNPRIVEYANDSKNFPALPSKENLKELYRDVIPVEILTRKKQGFGAPVKNWLSIGLLDELVEEYVYKKTLPVYQILKYEKVLVECKRNPTFLWNILSLNVWLKANVPN
jgi:asparagine synthase (glutamine-hydrolysing)